MSHQKNEPIAIIGSSCRFPGGASSPSKLWELLREPRDLLREIPSDRFNAKGFYHPNALQHGNNNVQHAYFLSQDHRHFDAKFFGIKGVETHAIDPQQRLFLETVYEEIEAAGLRVESLRGSDTAVYMGLMCGDYEAMLFRDLDTVPIYHATGIARSIMANRISYFFDWHGPSLIIDIACFSSLVALHQTVQSLRIGESRVAIVAGSNLILKPENFIAESKFKMLSSIGRFRMWDKDADGYARGEGVTSVVLKPLNAAIIDGDYIECLVRETGVNQDGRTRGITMPSATAQTSFIRDTYARASLDPRRRSDRCQYFEAHGTGTPTGDPLEAEAVRNAFFPEDGYSGVSTEDLLFVGSVKTVVGHTEGTAGLAGVLKASLALQNDILPLNMFFTQLNPSIKQFYSNLRILSRVQLWPSLPVGQPRRASVNSFGFGGINVYVILENYEPKDSQEIEDSTVCFTPFTFSANFNTSLVAQLIAFSTYLSDNSSINIRDLNFSLNFRRTVFPIKALFTAQKIEDLQSQIKQALETPGNEKATGVGTRSINSESPAILGIFTGQGAQYAQMGAELLLKSHSARHCFDNLEHSLSTLSSFDRPKWSLKEEILADDSSNRLVEATLSQPLCTAVQIMLVDILRETGVNFKAVVGHSSGEIGAAYAAGFISARDAIRIAYYRGLHSHLAVGKDGVKGAMMAVATTLEDVHELCGLPDFDGRVTVAAINSAVSVTLSGDEDAIWKAKIIFADENKKATILKVDKAYHSQHMVNCSDAYLRSMEECGVELRDSQGPPCTWYSSVNEKAFATAFPGLLGSYWNDNLVRPVSFMQALKNAVEQTPFLEAIVEVGAHPSLKGPAFETIQDILKESIPYTGLLRRGTDAIDAVSEGIGYLWTRLGERAIDLTNFNKYMAGNEKGKLLKNLPTYQWDHDKVYWQESRLSRALRTRSDPVQQLLGSKCPNGTAIQMSWKNLLRVKEVPWLRGHALQEQTVFPAAGYVATAIEASKHLPNFGNAKLLEIQNFVIHQPMIFNDDEDGVEILFSFFDVHSENELTSTSFTYHSAPAKDSDAMTLMASGQVQLVIGTPSMTDLPTRSPVEPNMIKVETDRFYDSLAEIGYGYTGPFRALSSMERKSGKASGMIRNAKADSVADPLMIHPAMLDATIQSVILAYCYPNDGQLWSLHLPTSIDRIRINIQLCSLVAGEDMQLPFDSTLSKNLRSGIYGDVSLYTAYSAHALLQLEGMRAVPFTGATSDNDSNLFSLMHWDLAGPNGVAAVGVDRASDEEYELAFTLERVASFYLRSLDQQISRSHPARQAGPYVGLFNYATHVNSLVSSGNHPYTQQEWIKDDLEYILSTTNRFPGSPDLKIMHIVGKEMPRVIRGETTILEHLLPNNLLNKYYSNALGFPQFTTWLSRMTSQLTHRYPRMKILQIGAGTGGATKGILKQIDNWYSSYTFTDISNGFFENAQETFKVYTDKMTFKVLDIEKSVSAQGFEEESFDLIIASFVLHATTKLEHTVANARRLLKPGGHILMAEVTNNDQIRGGFIFGALPGWWLGAGDGRELSPCVSPAQWDAVLRKSGFSGVDAITSDVDSFPYPGSVILSQAVDAQINFLRRPLSAPYPQDLGREPLGSLLIIGGTTLKTTVLVEELSEILIRSYPQIDHIDSIAEATPQHLLGSTAILCLAELDEPIFKNLASEDFQGLKNIFSQERTIMWITQGRRAEAPESNMTYGFVRSQLWEVPDLRVQFIDLECELSRSTHVIAENFIRFSHLVTWETAGRLINVLWSIEPELVLKSNDFLIPRLSHWKEANNRLNSTKRRISHKIDLGASNIGVVKQEGSQSVIEQVQMMNTLFTEDDDYVNIAVKYSLTLPTRTVLGCHYIAFETVTDDHSQMIAVIDTQEFFVRVPRARTVSCPRGNSDIPQIMLLLAYNLMVDCLLSKINPGDVLMIHEPNVLVSRMVGRSAAEKGFHFAFTTSNTEDKLNCTFIHPYATAFDIKKIIPTDIALFVDLSTHQRATDIGPRMIANLPPSCDVERFETLFVRNRRFAPLERAGSFQTSLEYAYSMASRDAVEQDFQQNVAVIDITKIDESQLIRGPLNLIDWASSSTVDVELQPVDSKDLFSRDKTYWLAGLTGGLGLSLCEWMVQHGAKYIVLSSRNPKIDQRWRNSMAAIGAVVKIFASDITDREAVQKLYREISSTLPPVSGVAQGAMMLHDMPTRDMSFQDLEKVLRPKVQGSKHLNELFQENTLDFFVFFSSMTGVVGNMGQSNYTSANTFMCALASQRKMKGLAASVINIGVIIGLGYVTREVSHADQKNLRKGGYMWMSERDFHQIFAEAVLVGHPDSRNGPEIFTGLRRISPDEPYQPVWYKNPVFAKCLLQKEAVSVQEANNVSGPSIKTRLSTAINATQIASALEDGFTAQLQTLLGGIGDDVKSKQAMLESRTDELGIDSLIAVEIRSWFLNNLSVNIPVLKILGGVIIKDLLQFALKELPRDFVPKVSDGRQDISPPKKAVLAVEILASEIEPSHEESGSFEASLVDLPSEKEGSSDHTDSTPPSSTSEVEFESETRSVLDEPLVQEDLAMSCSQSMFWFITVYLQDKATLNHFGYSRVLGGLRVHDLKRAVDVVAQRHKSLRTRFYANEEQQPMQGILETSPLRLEHRWIDEYSELHEECTKLKNHIYELERGETMRIVLLSKSADEHYLLIGCHHINVDGISHQVLMSDLEKVYDHKSLSDRVLQYPEYSAWQQAQIQNEGWKSELAYWKTELNGFDSVLPPLTPSSVISRRPLLEYAVHRVEARVDSTSSLRIKDVCRRNRVTPFHFYLTVLKILLFRLSSIDDLCIGMADGNRSEGNMLDAIGPFVNLLPLRFRLQESQSFQKALREARSKTYDALSNSKIPFKLILSELNVPRSVAHSPLFQAFVDYRQGTREKMPFGECQLEMMEFHAGRTAYDLSLDIIDDPAGQPLLIFMAQTSLYSHCDTEIMTRSYMNLVDAFAKEPECNFDHAILHKPMDTEEALEFGRGIISESIWPETLLHRIENVMEEFHNKTAIIDVDGTYMTYKEVSNRTNTIASKLMDAGTNHGSVVAVFQEPGADWVCSFLAIMKIGAIYLPLDLGTPMVRLALMAADSKAKVILFHKATKDRVTPLKAGDTEAINISTLTPAMFVEAPILARQNSAAIILYTSGSTDTPKGIVLKHSSFVNEVETAAQIYDLGSEDVILQQSALGFDMSVLQIFLALAFGASLCLLPRSSRGDLNTICDLLVREGISWTCATPSEYTNWLTYGNIHSLRSSAWKTALSGGEPILPNLIKLFCSFDKSDLQLYNGYGPTETTCCSTITQIDYRQSDLLKDLISAGFPSPNESVYIVDEKSQMVPVGVSGEIVIGGVGVALGYLHDPQMTSEKFVPDLFAGREFIRNGWNIMYRTGDKGRWRSDGSLSLEGRLFGDTQVKLRGLRIELREVEDAIIQVSAGALATCVVSVRSDNLGGPEYLVAHVVFIPDVSLIGRRSLLQTISSTLPLPQYMRPATTIAIDRFPTNSSGKVDRRSIANLSITSDLEADSDPTKLASFMSRLMETWKEVIPSAVFGRHQVSAESDFFHVGGDSILLVKLQALIKRNFEVSIPLPQLFAAPTLLEMANRIEDRLQSIVVPQIDWYTETEPEPGRNIIGNSLHGNKTASSPRIVVLTGATGFLGPYLVNKLVENLQVEKIHCLAVRNLQNRQSLLEIEKVILHEGDLTLPLLGLPEEIAEEIFKETDVIIHNGADTSHLKAYQTLRLANVSSTKELVKLSFGRKIPIHYVSTTQVALLSPREIFKEVSVASTLPPWDGSDGYTASKWASERFLERSSERFELPVWIHRPSSITRSSSLLGEDATEMELLQNLLKYSRLMKTTPAWEKLRGALDLVTADHVAEGIVGRAIATRSSPISHGAVAYVHQTGDFCLPISGMKAFLEAETNTAFETVPIGEWAERATALGLNIAVAATFSNVEQMDGTLVFPSFVKGTSA